MQERYLVARCRCGWNIDFPWSDCGDDKVIVYHFHASDTKSGPHPFEGAITPVFRKEPPSQSFHNERHDNRARRR